MIALSYQFAPLVRSEISRQKQLSALAHHKMRSSSYPLLRSIRCDCRDGVITLSGQVSSYFLKQMAQELILDLCRGEHVANQIEVTAGSV